MIDNSGGRPFTKEKAILKKKYHKNTNIIIISAMAFLMLLPLSSSVSPAGEALYLKIGLFSHQRAKHVTDETLVTIEND